MRVRTEGVRTMRVGVGLRVRLLMRLRIRTVRVGIGLRVGLGKLRMVTERVGMGLRVRLLMKLRIRTVWRHQCICGSSLGLSSSYSSCLHPGFSGFRRYDTCYMYLL